MLILPSTPHGRLVVRKIDQQLEQRKDWLEKTMSTVEHPYLRIAAVLVGPAATKGKR